MSIENRIINELSTGVLVLDKTLKVLSINSSAQTLLDVTQKNAKDDFYAFYLQRMEKINWIFQMLGKLLKMNLLPIHTFPYR